MNFFQTSDVALHYQLRAQAADKPVLVFSNSLGTDFRIWDDMVSRLSQDFTLLTYDKRGHGLSDLGSVPYSMEDHINDLCQLLDHLELSQVILCGLSVGGLIAQGVSAARPDLVRGLVLCDTGHKIGTFEIWQERIDALAAEGLAPMVNAVMERWFTAEFRREDNPLFHGCRTMFDRQDVRGYSATCTAIQATDFTSQTKAISVPTLCIVGDQDAATPPALVKELSALIQGAEFQIIENSGHIPCVEQPQILSDLIKDFMTRKNLWKTAHD